jgi:hypothetical protein
MNYEIHLTIQLSSNIEDFKIFCEEIGAKPIIIETQNKNAFQKQVMTSSKHTGSHYLFTLNNLVSKLESKYKIIRKKVEIQPENIIHTKHIYYETHLRLKLPINFNYQHLQNLCEDLNFHLSKNLFKKSSDFIWQMITYRDYNTDLESFKSHIETTIQSLKTLDIIYDKIEIEECIHDSNENIDNSWLKQDKN